MRNTVGRLVNLLMELIKNQVGLVILLTGWRNCWYWEHSVDTSITVAFWHGEAITIAVWFITIVEWLANYVNFTPCNDFTTTNHGILRPLALPSHGWNHPLMTMNFTQFFLSNLNHKYQIMFLFFLRFLQGETRRAKMAEDKEWK